MKKKKNIPPANGILTTFRRIADVADIARIHIIADLFRDPQVNDRTRLEKEARAPYVMAENSVVSSTVSLQISVKS